MATKAFIFDLDGVLTDTARYHLSLIHIYSGTDPLLENFPQILPS